MKKLSKVLIIILVISLVSGCGFIENRNNEKADSNSTQAVEDISKYDNLEINQPYLVAKVIREGPKTDGTQISGKREYNKNGDMLKRVNIEEGEKVSYEEYKYDKEGRVKVHIEPRYGMKGEVEITKIYKYDEDGKKVGCIIENKEGKKVGEINYEYHENGNLKYKNIEKNYKGYEREIYYNERGHKTKQVTRDIMLGKAVSEFEQEYDEEANRIKKKRVTEVEGKDKKQIMIWHYNEFGETDEYITKRGDQITFWVDRNYDEEGNEIKSYFKNSDGEVEEIRKYEYNDRGNKTKEKRIDIVDGERKINLWFEHEYRKDGKPLKTVAKGPEGKVGTIERYKYKKIE